MKSQEDGICSCFCSGGEGQKYFPLFCSCELIWKQTDIKSLQTECLFLWRFAIFLFNRLSCF